MTAMCQRPDLNILDNAEEMADQAAACIIAFVTSTQRPVLCLATGRTPLAVCARLRVAFTAGEVSFADTTTFNLEEDRGLPQPHVARVDV